MLLIKADPRAHS